jgi:hypothetical protein
MQILNPQLLLRELQKHYDDLTRDRTYCDVDLTHFQISIE